MGSVKDLVVLEQPESLRPGKCKFVFSDRFSVFDWGVMPDTIDNKGKALCIMGAYFFEKLEKESGGEIKTHYLGILEDGRVKRLSEVSPGASQPNQMLVKLLRVIKPELRDGSYDYSVFRREKANFLIPLEVIYRNSLPEGSSVFKRLKEGKIALKDLGLDEFPAPGQRLVQPFVDFSTKLEEYDRYLSYEEAKEISGLDDREFEMLKSYSLFANELISKQCSKVGISNEDGKFEFGLDELRQLMFVDVLGTPDECRFIYKGVQVSKEVLRKFYRSSSWYLEVEEAKKMDPVNWRKLVKTSPPPIPSELKELVSQLYMSCCNALTEIEWFKSPPLEDVIKNVSQFI